MSPLVTRGPRSSPGWLLGWIHWIPPPRTTPGAASVDRAHPKRVRKRRGPPPRERREDNTTPPAPPAKEWGGAISHPRGVTPRWPKCPPFVMGPVVTRGRPRMALPLLGRD